MAAVIFGIVAMIGHVTQLSYRLEKKIVIYTTVLKIWSEPVKSGMVPISFVKKYSTKIIGTVYYFFDCKDQFSVV